MKGVCKVRASCQEHRNDFRPAPDLQLCTQEFHVPFIVLRLKPRAKAISLFPCPLISSPDNLLFPEVEVKLPGSP